MKPIRSRADKDAVRQHAHAGRLDQAVPLLHTILAEDPEDAEAHFLLGTALAKAGRLEDSLEAFRRAVALAPENVVAWRNLGISLSRLGRHEEAVDCLQRARRIEPDNPDRYFDIAVAQLEQQALGEAEANLGEALRQNPDHAQAHIAMGRLLLRQGRYRDARAHLEQALGQQSNDMRLLLETARAQRETGGLAEAAVNYGRVLETDSESVAARVGLAITRTAQGRVDEAARLYEEALDRDPENPAALGNYARIHRYVPDDPLILRMVKVAGKDGLSDEHKIQIEFSIGKAFDDVGDYDSAFTHYRSANQLASQPLSFDPDAFRSFVDRTVEVFDEAFFAERRDWGERSDMPVFIVGMGRSGTSLTEQILASHPAAFGAGELSDIENIAASIVLETGAQPGGLSAEALPDAIPALGAVEARRFGQAYLHRLCAGAEKAERLSDKMPLNFQFLGLIAAILPGARIVHCRRDPLDTCISLYFQHFADSQPYAYDLTHLGLYYREYDRLMRHWQRVLPLPMMEIGYEALVHDQEREIHRLVEFCGLPWDKQCLAFHETERPVGTASVWQVRQPIYKSSVGRWRNYAAHLKPLMGALGALSEGSTQDAL